ncbi:unnamed protein product [Allacma fusca]|uniref:C-type lectin domain-containing protein n=1 Tax=Allacma fusca TaxID=39272 RepID=A0A8J2JKH7_9HEXA|nr:unnamed protein product [Allacma fusca]
MKSIAVFVVLTCLSSGALSNGIPLPANRTLPAPGPDGMIHLSGKSRAGTGYTISTFSATFWNAIDYCRRTNRKLLAIEDSAEQMEISLLLTSYNIAFNMWTSGVEISPGELVWASTLEKVDYSNIGNTNNGQDNCLAIVTSGPNRNKWMHSFCQNWYYFICEA